MATSSLILRKSIHHFLANYHYFTSVSSLLALPFSISILLSQFLFLPSSSNSLFPAIFFRLQTLFQAAGFPSSSDLSLKLSQTLTSFVFALPFAFTFLILAKSSVILAFTSLKNASVFDAFNPLLLTFFCNSLLIVSANATAFALLFLAFNFFDLISFSSPAGFLLLSAAGAVAYSVVLANAIAVSNLALILSGEEKSGGFLPFLKALIMIRGKTLTALSIALPANLALAGVEALFQYRIVSQYRRGETPSYLTVVEGVLIAYIYSNLIVVDTIASCNFLKHCEESLSINGDEEEGECYRVEIGEDDQIEEKVSLKVCEGYA